MGHDRIAPQHGTFEKTREVLREPASAPKSIAFDYTRPLGAPALCAPDSLHWRIYRNPIALGIGGVCAVLLEFADSRIRSGVWDHSIYKIDPIGRSKRTGLVAAAGVYGAEKSARALIGGVNRMHKKVVGQTPDGKAYQALDPILLNWVYATAAWGFLKAYCTFVRPLSRAQCDQFFKDSHAIAALYGVTDFLESEADFDRMLQNLLPTFEAHPINLEFLHIIASGQAAPSIPKFLHKALANAAVALLPAQVRHKLALGPEWDLTRTQRLALKWVGKLADIRRDKASPAWQAAERLGLPGEFSWLSAGKQAAILARHPVAKAGAASHPASPPGLGATDLSPPAAA